ncbi:MAG: cytochrome c [Alphaproteobacteria bacterium]|nr:cytochrome c [Alphaproteobacteria bacterium]
MVTPPLKHMVVYGALGTGLVGYVGWTLVESTMGYPWMTWFIDMMDAQYVRAYERPMAQLPEGVVSRNMYVANYDRNTPEGQGLTHKYTVDEDFIAKGEWSFNTYCVPCHNNGGTGMGPVTDNSSGKRFRIPGVALAGAGGVAKTRTDGYIYLTIRNGGALMPSYSWAMSDEEMWAVVSYIRTLPESKYIPPAPPADAPEEG